MIVKALASNGPQAVAFSPGKVVARSRL